MSKHLIYVDTKNEKKKGYTAKANQKATSFYHLFESTLTDNTKNATQCTCNSVDLGAPLVLKISLKKSHHHC